MASALLILLWQNWAPFCPWPRVTGQSSSSDPFFELHRLAAGLSRLPGEIEKTQTPMQFGAPSDLGWDVTQHLCEEGPWVWRTLLPNLEGIQQDNPGSLPKHSLALDGVSQLDISLFNLFLARRCFQPGMCKLIPKCLHERPVTLITEIFLPLLFKKKKKV